MKLPLEGSFFYASKPEKYPLAAQEANHLLT